MNTMVGTIPMDAVLSMLNSLSRHDRAWLVKQLSERVEREEAEAGKSLEVFLNASPTWEEEDNAKLDEALSHFSGDWGGDGTPMEIARELRQGSEMVRKIETW